MRYVMPPEEHARIFGASDDMGAAGTGRVRKCRTCGGWHRAGAWPHNCRPPVPPRNPRLAAPQVAPVFHEFRTGVLPGAEVVGDRRAKREYMERHGLAEFDEGIQRPEEHWTYEREQERAIGELMADLSHSDTEGINARLTAETGEPIDVTNPERVGDDPDLGGVGQDVAPPTEVIE